MNTIPTPTTIAELLLTGDYRQYKMRTGSPINVPSADAAAKLVVEAPERTGRDQKLVEDQERRHL